MTARIRSERITLPMARLGAPSNMPAFATAFGCKAGDPMVRAEDQRIAIW